MNDIKTEHQSPFFPKDRRSSTLRTERAEHSADSTGKLRNNKKRQLELKEGTENDARVDISDKIKDFSRIKKAVDNAPEIDNRNKIADLKNRIESGTYKIDYDGLANKMLADDLDITDTR